MKNVLYIGPMDEGGTCYSRYLALRELTSISGVVDSAKILPRTQSRATRIMELIRGNSVHLRKANEIVLNAGRELKPSAVWIDKGDWIFPSTIRRLQSHGARVFQHVTDALWPRHLIPFLTQKLIRSNASVCDIFFTTNARDFTRLRPSLLEKVQLTRMGYDASRFYPASPGDAAQEGGFRSELCFIGHYEPRTAVFIDALLSANLPITVFGGRDWIRSASGRRLGGRLRPPVWGKDYVTALQTARIGLCFLSKWNYNLSTVRSFEIPACATFMLAMRTTEHEAFFREGTEAEFFGDASEMVHKATRYLKDEGARSAIAAAGYKRILGSRYSWNQVMADDWAKILERWP